MGVRRLKLFRIISHPNVTPTLFLLLSFAFSLPAQAQITFEEQAIGGTSDGSSVSTSSGLTAVAGHLYLAAITSKPNTEVTAVSGLGLSWQEVDSQCAGRDQTGVRVWMAIGAPSGSGMVTATLAGSPSNTAIVVARYSGVTPSGAVGAVISGNSNGVDGSCSGGTDSDAYSFNLTTTGSGSVVFGAIAMRHKSHTPGAGYTELQEFTQGSGGSAAGVALVERSVSSVGTIGFDGTTSGSVDWAVIAIELKGEPLGDVADITVTPASHNYGDVVVNGSASQRFEVKNDGAADLNVSGTSLSGADAGGFSIDSGGGSFTLIPGESRNIDVSFNPTVIASHSAVLRIGSDDPDEGTFDVALSGTGVAEPAPEIAVTPTSHDYGDVVVNESASQTFQVENTGSADLTVSATSLTGTDAAEFSIDSGGGGFVLMPGQMRDIGISFNPTSLGAKTASFEIASDDPDEGTVVLGLSGNGVSAPTPDITVSPTSHDYGNVIVGLSGSQTFTVTNDGQADLQVSNTTLVGTDSGEFNIDSGGGSFTLPPGESRNIEVSFAPTSTGGKSATLRIESDDADEGTVDAALSGTGEEAPSGGGNIVFEEQATGGTSDGSSVSTSSGLTAVAGHLYLAAITSKPNTEVTAVSGLGLSWQEVDSQCAGRDQTGVRVWMAIGAPSGSGMVTATLAGSPSNTAIVVARYSGVTPSGAVGAVISGNSNGVDGSCSGGTDSDAYSFNLTTTGSGSVVFGAIAMRHKSHTPGAGYTELQEFTQGSGGSAAGVALVERSVSSVGTIGFDGTTSGSVDWAVIAIELKGEPLGDVADITVTPASHNYGDVVVNGSASQRFEVKNDGAADLNVSGTSLSGADAGGFSIDSGGGSFTLIPGESRNIDVSFNPTVIASHSAVLRIGSDDPDEGTFDVALSGTGVAEPAPEIAVTPTSHDYGDVVVNESASQTFQVENTGSADLTVSATSLTGTDAAEFSIDSGGGGFVLMPGQMRDIGISFNPTSLGAKTASFEIASDDPDEGTVVLGLSGNGVSAPTPDITVSPTSHDYGNVIVGLSGSQTFTVTNDGQADLQVSNTTLVGTDSGEFNIDSGGGSFTLPPGESRNIEVSFAPTSTGGKSATLRIESDDADEGVVDIALSGTGDPAMPDIVVTPETHDYDNVAEGASSSKSFEIKNAGTLALNVTSTSLSGTNAAEFSIDSGGGSFTLQPDETSSLQVCFNPGSTGSKSAELAIASDDPDENPFVVALSGTGIPQQAEIVFVRSFTTDSPPINSFTNAGITYNPVSGNLYICDSEINQGEGGDWNCENIFEVPLLGDVLVNSYDAYALGGSPCPPLSNDDFREPTGITYHNGFFYITDDDRGIIMRHDSDFGESLLQVDTQNKDAEGISGDPNSGLLYVVIGNRGELEVYDENLNFQSSLSWTIPTNIADPEGIAFSTRSNHLFLVSTPDLAVYELDLTGNLLETYDISSSNGFSPEPRQPQGLTFAPSSDPNDDPGKMHLYISDGAGLVFETEINTESLSSAPLLVSNAGNSGEKGEITAVSNLTNNGRRTSDQALPTEYMVEPNYPNPFNSSTTIEYGLPHAAEVDVTIYNVRGQQVRKLLNRELDAGYMREIWNGRNDHGEDVASGVYFLRITINNERMFVRKLNLQK